jgi:hypothetical protein
MEGVIQSDPDLALQRLCAPHARMFGERLLAVSQNGTVTFQQFLEVARELVATLPDQTATWLAALVALEMRREQEQPRPPSRN